MAKIDWILFAICWLTVPGVFALKAYTDWKYHKPADPAGKGTR